MKATNCVSSMTSVIFVCIGIPSPRRKEKTNKVSLYSWLESLLPFSQVLTEHLLGSKNVHRSYHQLHDVDTRSQWPSRQHLTSLYQLRKNVQPKTRDDRPPSKRQRRNTPLEQPTAPAAATSELLMLCWITTTTTTTTTTIQY